MISKKSGDLYMFLSHTFDGNIHRFTCLSDTGMTGIVSLFILNKGKNIITDLGYINTGESSIIGVI